MIDIANQKVNIGCPKCGAKIEVTTKKIADQAIVQCKNCEESFQLIDDGGKAKKAMRDINRVMGDFEKALKNFGK